MQGPPPGTVEVGVEGAEVVDVVLDDVVVEG